MAETVLEVDSVDTALAIFGNCDENIRLLEQAFGVTAICRGTEVKLTRKEFDLLECLMWSVPAGRWTPC